MAKHKSLVQKAIDAVDHAIHPDHADQDQATEQDLEAPIHHADERSADEKNDIQNHRKFSKFKTGEA